MIKYHFDVVQGSEEWDNLRIGKLTASNATAIKSCGKGLKTYSRKIAREKLGVFDDSYMNQDMERGNEFEPEAFELFQLETGIKLQTCGFIENSEFENVGISPDGINTELKIGFEIKARNNAKHFDLIQGETSDIPINQIQMSLLVTGYKVWYFVSYNPNFKKHPIFIKAIYPDNKTFILLKKGFKMGNELINKAISTYNEYGR